MSPPRKSSSLLLFNAKREVFFVKRNSKTRFFKNSYVFPGGVEEELDGWRSKFHPHIKRQLDLDVLMGLSEEEYASRMCAIREAFEEAGICLFRSKNCNKTKHDDCCNLIPQMLEYRQRVHDDPKQLLEMAENLSVYPDVAKLIPYQRWITPTQEKRRYDTKFYLAKCSEEQQAAMSHDGKELVESEWLTPRDALQKFSKGLFFLPPPTWMLLKELEPYATESWEAVVEHAGQRGDFSGALQPNLVKKANTIVALPGDPEHQDYEEQNPVNHGRYNRIEIVSSTEYRLNRDVIEQKAKL